MGQMTGYLEWFEVYNFQSWEHVKVELSPGVNVFVGPTSDVGKSGLAIRSLLWLIENTAEHQIDGSSNIRSWWATGKDETSIAAKFSDCPDVIKRIKRGTTVNKYMIGSRDFDKPGATVPDAISRILNIQDVNIHRQKDQFFFIGLTDPEKARYLNKLVNLDEISETLTNIAGQLKRETDQQNIAKATLKTKKEDLKDYDWTSDAETSLEKLEIFDRSIAKKEDDETLLKSTIASIKETQSNIAALRPILSAKEKIESLYVLQNDIALNRLSLSQLNTLITNIKDRQRHIERLSKIIQAKDKILDMESVVVSFDKKVEDETNIIAAIEAVEKTQKKLKQATDRRNKLRLQFKKMMPKVCPLCNEEISK